MSIRVETSIWIDRSPLEVFEYMTTIDNWTSYMPGLLSAQKLTDGPKGVGTQIAISIGFLGSSVDLTAEWFRFEPGVAIGSKNVNDPKMGSVSLTTLEVENGGTRLERVLDIEPHGFFTHLTAPLIQLTTNRNIRIEFENIKAAMEVA